MFQMSGPHCVTGALGGPVCIRQAQHKRDPWDNDITQPLRINLHKK